MKIRRHSQVASVLIRAMAILVILAVAIFDTAYVLGLHIHVLPDGRVVTHSHPIDRSEESGSQHQHSDYEYAVLTASGRVIQADCLHIGWSPVYIELATSWIELPDDNVISGLVSSSLNMRGPPKVISG